MFMVVCFVCFVFLLLIFSALLVFFLFVCFVCVFFQSAYFDDDIHFISMFIFCDKKQQKRRQRVKLSVRKILWLPFSHLF